MSDVRIIFGGSELSETQNHELECYANFQNDIYINIDMCIQTTNPAFICLNKKAAIRFHKELKIKYELCY